MDSTQRGIITLINSAVQQKPLPLPGDFSLEKAYPLITRQHIAPLAFEGCVLCGVPQHDPVMSRLFQSYCKALQISEGQLEMLRKLEQVFQSNGIDYLPLKGAIMKKYYPKPELRSMGDADILIRAEQYDRIIPLLKQLGFSYEEESDCHFSWGSDKLELEMHRQLIPEKYRAFTRYFRDGWHMAIPEKGLRYKMSPEDTFLFLFVHFTKHYLESGIGCRHVLDLWVYLRSNPQLNTREVYAKLQELGLDDFYGNVLKLMEYWFHDGQPNEKLEEMTQFFFSGGSWGTLHTAALSETILNSKQAHSKNNERLRFYWRKVFPSVITMKQRYPILKKYLFLLPVAWVVRVLKIILVRRNIGSRLKLFRKAVTQENLDQRRKFLQDVGLDAWL